jgi:predicted nucleic acid-binding protein
MTYAFDTNTIIHLLNYNALVLAKKEQAIADGGRFIIPPVVDYEIQRGLLYKPSPKKEVMYSAIVEHYGIGEMTAKMWTQAASIYSELRRKSFTIDDADIFIAAFCIVNGYTLITNNAKHFDKIEGLLSEDWVID